MYRNAMVVLDCEQSLSFPSVFKAIERAVGGEPRAASREKRGPASPHSLLVSLPNLHNINKVPHAEDFRNCMPPSCYIACTILRNFACQQI